MKLHYVYIQKIQLTRAISENTNTAYTSKQSITSIHFVKIRVCMAESVKFKI